MITCIQEWGGDGGAPEEEARSKTQGYTGEGKRPWERAGRHLQPHGENETVEILKPIKP
jgi:hypothetical protein